MRFFTPELLAQGNTADADAVVQVDEAWEEATERYAQHLAAIECSLPESLRSFHCDSCLHDAEIYGPTQSMSPANGNGTAAARSVTLTARRGEASGPDAADALIILHYEALAGPTFSRPIVSEAIETSKPLWLNEEVDVVAPGVYSHEILLSDGHVVKIVFRDFYYEVAPIIGVAEGSAV
jgi:hypothetical protein